MTTLNEVRKGALEWASEQKDGPVQKFHLIKTFGPSLAKAGHEPKAMSCVELRKAIKSLKEW